MINAVCGSGSTGRIVTDLCDVLKKDGNFVKVAYGIGTATRIDASDAIKIETKVGYYIHNALSRFADRAGFYSCIATRKLISAINVFKPDVIHIHNLHGYYVNIKMLFQYLASQDIPVVWTLHDCWAMTGHCAHFSYIHCDKWVAGCHHCPQLRAYPKCYLLDRSARNYKEKKRLFTSVKRMTIATPSEWLAGIVRKSFLNRYEVQVIPNGIDLNVFKPTPSDFRERYGLENKKIVLEVSNVWIEKKGFSDVCKLSQMLDQGEFQVVMVGLTEKQMNCVPKTILPIQRTSSMEELVQIYSAADIFINPSYEETMGMVTVEAMACGLPCIVYDQTAVPEVIDSETGIVVRAGDISAMCTAIHLMETKSEFGCKSVAKDYCKESSFAKYKHLYENIVR